MKLILVITLFLSTYSLINSQNPNIDWYSECESNGIVIQNSYPKGGPYMGPSTNHFRPSYLVFFSRVINKTNKPFEIDLDFSSDSIPIPNSPNTYMKFFLPPETMTMEKRSLFSYGVTELKSLEESTHFEGKLNPGEDCLFYVVAIFYQTRNDIWKQERGGNRAELVLRGNDLFYKMSPQVESLKCGRISFLK